MSSLDRVGGDPPVKHAGATPLPSGTRSGMVVALASGASIVANYVFLLSAGRILGSDDYGSLAALLGMLAVVLIPASAIQLAVAREVSRLVAGGEHERADAFARQMFQLALWATLPLLIVALALAAPLAALLNIDSVALVMLAELTFVTALVGPVALGVLQGRQRFNAYAAVLVGPFVLRLALLAVTAVAGYRLGGVVFAAMASAIAGTAFSVLLIWEPLKRGSGDLGVEIAPFLRYLAPVGVGLISIALLTHVDLLIVKARFSADEAGAYASASAFARVAFFLPATILAVLFPRTAARQARGEQTEDILGRSLLATAVFCGLLVLVYAAAGVGLISTTFGPDFAEGGEVLAPFALAIGLFSIANILVGYHLSRGETRYAWILAAGIVLQVSVLAIVPSSLHGVVWANVFLGLGLVAAHEVLVGSSVSAVRAGLRHFAAGVGTRLRRIATEGVVVVLGATVFVCLLLWPIVAHLGSTVIGSLGSDSTGGVWWLWALQHEGGYHLLGTTHHTLTGAPFGWDDGNGLNLQWLLPYYPAYLATKVVGEVAAFNLVVLSGYALSGAAMYALARYLGCVRLVSTWAALVYIVFPWHLARAEHASLVHVEVLALVILALVAAVRRPTWTRFGLVGAATLACWLTSGYYGAEALVTAAAFALGAALTADRKRGGRIVFGATACALAATALISIGSFTSGVNRGAGLHRSAEDVSINGLHPDELVVPADGNLLLSDRLKSFHETHLHGTNVTEATNYLGLLTIALAIAWVVIAWRRRTVLPPGMRAATAGLVAAVATGLLFAAPSPITIVGHQLWMPSRLLWELVPAFRVPSRWTPLVMAALVPLSALGLQAVARRLANSTIRPPAVFAAVVGFALVFSFLELTIAPTKHRFRTVPTPSEYRAVERTAEGLLAEYPLGSSDVYRFWQREHHRPLVNGAPAGTPADDARLVLLDPTMPGTAQSLRLLGVTAIVIHQHAVVDAEVSPQTPSGGDGYELVSRFPDGDSVWRILASRAGAFVTLPGGFAKPRREENGLVGYPFVAGSGVGVIQLRARTPALVLISFEAQPPGGGQGTLRLTDAEHEQRFLLNGRTRISLKVQIPRGLSQLLVKTDPAPTSEADAIVLSAPRATNTSGEAALRATPISRDPGF